jgi:uncharacterized protein YgiM (DUF1202 family)
MAWRLRAAPAVAAADAEAMAQPGVRVPRSFWQRGWDWFDSLSNLQTASFLSAMVLGMLLLAAGLLAASLLPPPRSQPASTLVAPPPAVQVSPPSPTVPQLVRAHTVPAAVNLRAEPTTNALLISTLPSGTEVTLLGDTATEDDATWNHVRLADGRVGWIIGSALE